MSGFPFPDRIGSREELKRDILYSRVDKLREDEIADAAWVRGVEAMKMLIERYPGMDIRQMADALGLTITHESKDNVAANIRFFSEYYSGKKKIILYDKSILLWANKNQMPVNEAEDLILSHELYHHLECTELGLTSKIATVPWIRIGSLTFGKCGLRSLSEIGAHGFSRTYYDLLRPELEEYKGKTLKNYALNETELRARGIKAKKGIRGLFS